MCRAPIILSLFILGQAQTAPVERENSHDGRVRDDSGFARRPGQTYREIPAMVRTITTDDVQLWSWMLTLSEAQQSALNSQYEHYLQEEDDIHWRVVQPLWDEAGSIATMGTVAADINLALRWAHLVENKRPRVVQTLAALDSRFLDSLVPILAEVQQPSLDRVRSHRERSRTNSEPGRFPGPEYDVDEALFSLVQDGMDMTPTNADALATLLHEYATRSRAALERQVDARLACSIRGTVALAGVLGGSSPEGRDLMRAERRELGRRLVEAERQIFDLNKIYVDRIAALLPTTTGETLRRGFHETIYPALYPDVTDISDIYKAIQGVKSLSNEQRTQIEAIKLGFQERHDALCHRMEVRYLDWREQHGIEMGNPNDIVGTYAREIRALQESRVENARSALAAISATLSPQQMPDIQSHIERFEHEIETFKFQADWRLGI